MQGSYQPDADDADDDAPTQSVSSPAWSCDAADVIAKTHDGGLRILITSVRSDAAVFSERELKFMFAICHRRSVCRLSSVTFVRPTQTIEIFRNVSTP